MLWFPNSNPILPSSGEGVLDPVSCTGDLRAGLQNHAEFRQCQLKKRVVGLFNKLSVFIIGKIIKLALRNKVHLWRINSARKWGKIRKTFQFDNQLTVSCCGTCSSRTGGGVPHLDEESAVLLLCWMKGAFFSFWGNSTSGENLQYSSNLSFII